MRPAVDQLYRHQGAALLRATVLCLRDAPRWWPDLTDVASCLKWLPLAWADARVADAVRQASPDLARRIGNLTDGALATDKDVRRATLAIMRYTLRAVGRPTPFGLFAGVAPVNIGAGCSVAWRGGDRSVARPDTLWLSEIITGLEAVPELRERLDVAVSDLAVRRGSRVEVPRAGDRVSVRWTSAVGTTLEAAAGPVRFSVLVDKLTATYRTADRAGVVRMLAGLIEQGFLLTCLRAPATKVDPLGFLLTRLADFDAAALPAVADQLTTLTAVHRGARKHNEGGGSSSARTVLGEQMATLAAPGRTALAVDMRLNCDVRVPEPVLVELARAAGVMLRLTRRPGGDPAWADYHAAFLARYGAGTLIPVTEAVHPDTGLGFPAGYPGSSFPAPVEAPQPRDARLLALAWQAIGDGCDEIVLDDATIGVLTAGDRFDDRWVPPHVELAARVHAASPEQVAAGDFRLVVAPARSAGTLTSRFTPTATGSGLEEVYRGVPTVVADAVPVQMSFPPLYPHAENVSRTPAYLPDVLSVGEHRPEGERAWGLDDLTITATGRALHLVCRTGRRVVEPQVFHALALEKQPAPLVRFLAHLTRGFCASWHEFDWGPHAATLPSLPRIRYGKTVISPARWRLTADQLDSAPEGWDQALRRWRRRRRCPAVVELRDADKTLRVDLSVAAHVALVRDQLDRDGHAAFTETGTAADYGWIGGRVHEVAVPLTTGGGRVPAPAVAAAPVLVDAEHGELPGSPWTAWLYAKVYAHPDRHPDLIAAVPRLLAGLPGDPAWWFVRYRDRHDPDHLRLRIRTCDPDAYGRTAAAVGAWAQQLRERRLCGRLVLDTYAPEVGRYGRGPAMAAAEAVFAADSVIVAEGLRLPASAVPPLALAAINMVDIAEGFLGSRNAAATWLCDRPAPAARVERATARHVTHWARHGTLPALPNPPASWTAARHGRRTALTAYQQTLPAGLDAGAVLESLLHMHHNRALGTDRDSEAVCRRLARHAALAGRTAMESAP